MESNKSELVEAANFNLPGYVQCKLQSVSK